MFENKESLLEKIIVKKVNKIGLKIGLKLLNFFLNVIRLMGPTHSVKRG